MRELAALIFLAAIIAVLLLINRHDPHPLMIDAAATIEVENGPSIAVPDPNALYAPCPLSPRNVLSLHRRLA